MLHCLARVWSQLSVWRRLDNTLLVMVRVRRGREKDHASISFELPILFFLQYGVEFIDVFNVLVATVPLHVHLVNPLDLTRISCQGDMLSHIWQLSILIVVTIFFALVALQVLGGWVLDHDGCFRITWSGPRHRIVQGKIFWVSVALLLLTLFFIGILFCLFPLPQ